MPSGGSRPGAGRKAKATKFGGQIATAEQRCTDRLPATLANLERIADGTAPQVETKYKPAGTITRKAVARDKAGEPIQDGKGKCFMEDVLVFPDLPADELVLVERTEKAFPPDYHANAYLADRVMGKPPQEVVVSGEDGGPIEITATHRRLAAIELEQWRAEMTARLSSLPNAPPTSPTSATHTG